MVKPHESALLMDPTRRKLKRSQGKRAEDGSGQGYLDGQLLIAMPVMEDERFARSVIYVCAHSSEGAMGIIVNRPAGSIDFPELLVQLNIIDMVSRSTPLGYDLTRRRPDLGRSGLERAEDDFAGRLNVHGDTRARDVTELLQRTRQRHDVAVAHPTNLDYFHLATSTHEPYILSIYERARAHRSGRARRATSAAGRLNLSKASRRCCLV